MNSIFDCKHEMRVQNSVSHVGLLTRNHLVGLEEPGQEDLDSKVGIS